MDIHGYSAHVLVNGRKVKEYRHNGHTYVEAKDGTEFAIEVKNHQTGRVLAIVSVDGLDIIDGKPATAKSRGYIVNGLNADVFNGWRKSDTEIGTFKFTSSSQSYATEKGRGQNNGVIAIKLIAEKAQAYVTQWTAPKPRPPFQPYPYFDNTGDWKGGNTYGGASGPTYGGGGTTTSAGPRRRIIYQNEGVFCGPAASANYCAVSDSGPQALAQGGEYVMAKAASFDMGTTWGSKREDKVVTTEFEYGNEIATLEFFYASREALKAMGIPLVNLREVSMPQAFESTYAQPPKNWKA